LRQELESQSGLPQAGERANGHINRQGGLNTAAFSRKMRKTLGYTSAIFPARIEFLRAEC
jgi:hypothetical protein